MKRKENIEQLLKGYLERKKSTVGEDMTRDKRIISDALAAYETGFIKESGRATIFSHPFFKLAAAFVIVSVIITAAVVKNNSQNNAIAKTEQGVGMGNILDSSQLVARKKTASENAELNSVKKMYDDGNVKGLTDILNEGELLAKIAAANYLAVIGDENALSPLETLSKQWRYDNISNPFEQAIGKIQKRMHENSIGSRDANTAILNQKN